MSLLNRSKIRVLVVLPVLLALLFASLILYANVLIHKPSVQKALVERLSRLTDFQIQVGQIELSLWGGIGFQAEAFEAASREGRERVAAETLLVALDPMELIRGRVAPVSLSLVRPTIEIRLPEDMAAAGVDEISGLYLPWFPGLKSLSLDRGTLLIQGRPHRIEGLNLEMRSKGSDSPILTVVSSGLLSYLDYRIPFRTHGTLAPPADLYGAGPVSIHAAVESVPLTWVPWPDKLSFEGGTATLEVSLEGSLNEPLAAKGRAVFSDVRFLLSDDEQTKHYQPPEVFVQFSGQVEGSGISLPEISLITEGLSLGLALDVALPVEDSSWIRLQLESEPMSFHVVERYFPAPLLPPWMEDDLFPILQSGTVRLEHLIISGTREEIESMNEPEFAGALSLSVDCRDFLVDGPSIPVPLEHVDGRVTYQEGDLLITGLKGSLDDSSIREGRLEVRQLLEERSVWDILVDGDFHISTLMRLRDIRFIPPDAFDNLNRLGPMTGTLENRLWFRYETGWPFPRLREGLVVIRDSELTQPELLLPIKLDRLEIRLAEEREHRFHVEGAWGTSEFKAGGALGIDVETFPFQSAQVSARLDMNQALPVLFRGYKLPLAFDAPVSTSFLLMREKNMWRCRGRVELEGVTLRNKHVSMNPPGPDDHIEFDLLLEPGEHLELEKVLCRFRNSAIEISGGYDLESNDLLTMEFTAPSLDLEDLGLRIHDYGRPTQGIIEGSVKIVTSRMDALSTMVLGSIQGSDISGRLHNLLSPVRDASFSIDFSGRTFSVSSCRMRVGKSELEIHGELEGWRSVTGEMSVHAEFLNPEDFLWRGERELRTGSLIPENIDIRLQIHGRNAHWNKLRFGPLRAEIHLTEGEIRLDRSRIRLEYGVLETNGHIRSSPSPEVFFSNHVVLNRQPVDELLRSFDMQGPFLRGTVNMEAFLTLKGKDVKDLLPSLSGNADVQILNGAFQRAGVLSKALESISLELLLKGKPGDLPAGSFYFESIECAAVIDRGVVSTENFAMSSPIYNAVAAGRADLNEKTVSFTLGIQPLETLDTVVSRIPIIGYALAGESGSFLTYYFEVAGPMDDPSTRHVPFRNLGGGVAGALKRLFLTPFRLYNNLSGGSDPVAEEP